MADETTDPRAQATGTSQCSARQGELRLQDCRRSSPRSASDPPGRSPAHDDLVDLSSRPSPTRLWLTDIDEHWTVEGKLYLGAIEDSTVAGSSGYSIDSRLKASGGRRRRATLTRRPSLRLLRRRPASLPGRYAVAAAKDSGAQCSPRRSSWASR
jgi:hypothetical protein